jgi:hypothetical protein
MAIVQYQRDVFIHAGGCSVEAFALELRPARDAIEAAILRAPAVPGFRVYSGFHGSSLDGCFDQAFNGDELALMQSMAQQFNGAVLVDWSKGMQGLEEIGQAIKDGSVFFTWCYADTLVQRKFPPLSEVTRFG